jgi:hypothetical protein
LKGFFDIDQILNVRQTVLENLAQMGVLDSNFAIDEARVKPGLNLDQVQPQLGEIPVVRSLIHGRALLDFFSSLLGDQSRAFDHIFVRTNRPTKSTPPHCDIVYMANGTHNLYTTWIPLGDVPRHHGSLMILEGSHNLEKLNKYRAMDIDEDNNWKKLRFKHGSLYRGVHYSKNARKVQQEFGLRWLTADYSAGDVIIFHTHLLHATLDNNSDRIRLSVDGRFQLADELMDNRYVGPTPILHKSPRPSILRKIFQRFKYTLIDRP